MKKFFKEADKEKEKSKIIELTSEINFEDIKDAFEEVDINGEEKLNEDFKQETEKKEKEENLEKTNQENKANNKKKKGKKGKK